MYCPKCGAYVNEGEMSCSSCGAGIGTSSNTYNQAQYSQQSSYQNQNQNQQNPNQYQQNQNQYQQNPYQNQNPYPQYGGYPYQPPKTNSMAVAGFVVSIVGVVIPFFALGAIVGVILSVMGYKRCEQSGEGGKNLALAGIIIGGVGILIGLISTIIWIQAMDTVSKIVSPW